MKIKITLNDGTSVVIHDRYGMDDRSQRLTLINDEGQVPDSTVGLVRIGRSYENQLRDVGYALIQEAEFIVSKAR